MSGRVFAPSERPFHEIQGAAIAITSVDEDQRHVGILHKEQSSGQVLLLHLAWHLALKAGPPKACYAWVDPPIHEARGRQVAARCRQVFRANERRLPYAFSPPNDCFDPVTGKYLFGPTRHGLTCATFVLAVFQSAGIRLVDDTTWPRSRQGDDEWREKILAALRNPQITRPVASKEHLAAIQREADLVRFRPEDVAGAAATDFVPASFEDVRPHAEEILQKLTQARLRLAQ